MESWPSQGQVGEAQEEIHCEKRRKKESLEAHLHNGASLKVQKMLTITSKPKCEKLSSQGDTSFPIRTLLVFLDGPQTNASLVTLRMHACYQ